MEGRVLATLFERAALEQSAKDAAAGESPNQAVPVSSTEAEDQPNSSHAPLVYVLPTRRVEGLDATIRSNVVEVMNANIRAGIAWDDIIGSKLAGRGVMPGVVEPVIRQLCRWFKVSREEVLRKYKR